MRRWRRSPPERTTAEWLALCEEHDIPATGFTRIEEVIEHPHLKAVEMFAMHDHPTEGRIRIAKPPTRFERTPANIRSMAPRLGEHTEEVLAELGFSAEAIADMQAAQGDPPGLRFQARGQGTARKARPAAGMQPPVARASAAAGSGQTECATCGAQGGPGSGR